MAEVNFYILASVTQQERLNFTCRLIEKMYRNGKFCYVLTESAEQAASLDKQLWTFRAGSFIPHQIYEGHVPTFAQTILIGGAQIPESRQNLIVNLSQEAPSVQTDTRILEIIDNNGECKKSGRQRYRHYQQLGFAINTYNI